MEVTKENLEVALDHLKSQWVYYWKKKKENPKWVCSPTLEVIEKTKPKFAIFENVKNLTSKKFAKEFEIILSSLDEVGYNTYYKVLNAKDYGTPQNRESVRYFYS